LRFRLPLLACYWRRKIVTPREKDAADLVFLRYWFAERGEEPPKQLTGKTPFDAAELLKVGLEEMRRTIREKEPEQPSTRASTLGVEELTTTASRTPRTLSSWRDPTLSGHGHGPAR